MPEKSNEELCILAVNGDIPSRDLLWQRTGRLFQYIAFHLYCRHRERADASGVESDDCCSVCWFAFLDTLKAFSQNTEQGYTFVSFAKLHIRRHIYDLLGYRKKRELLNETVSIDAPLPIDGGETTITIADTVKCPTAEIPFEEAENADIAANVLAIVSLLSERQQTVIHRHYWDSVPFTQIAAEAECTSQNIHCYHKDALRKLRKNARIQEIYKEFYASYDFYRQTGFSAFRDSGLSAVERAVLFLNERREKI